jgi:hypothetical protein
LFVHKPAIQPRKVAFSIWGVIFAAGIVRSVTSAVSRRVPSDDASLALHALAFVSCALWAPLFAQDYLRLACVCLGTAAALSLGSVLLTDPPATWHDLLLTAGADLLAGWVLVAFALSLVIARWAPDDTWLLLPLAAVVAVAAALASRPVLVVPVLWACVLQHQYDAKVRAAVGILIAGIVSSAVTLGL